MPSETTTKAKVKTNDKILANLVALKMTTNQPQMVDWMAKLVEACPTLHYIHMEFSGGGDSGDINYIDLRDSTETSIEIDESQRNSIMHPSEDGFLYKFLDQHVTCDWVNNDGGGGEVTFNLETGEVKVVSHYFEQVQTEHDDITVNLLN